MLIIPAIDLKDGQCVRLRKGLMEDSTVFSNNPTEMAAKWVDEGARRLHLVDLNGAFEGKPVNAKCVNEITKKILRMYSGINIDIPTLNWKFSNASPDDSYIKKVFNGDDHIHEDLYKNITLHTNDKLPSDI